MLGIKKPTNLRDVKRADLFEKKVKLSVEIRIEGSAPQNRVP
jgi:hypothetical protein